MSEKTAIKWRCDHCKKEYITSALARACCKTTISKLEAYNKNEYPEIDENLDSQRSL